MIKARIINNPAEIESLQATCLELAKLAGSNLPFQQMLLPRLWWKNFHSTDDADFGSKRGRNFLGARSWVEECQWFVAEYNGRLCGVAPLAAMRTAVKGQAEPVRLLCFCADSVLVFYHDFLVYPEYRAETVAALLQKITAKAEADQALVFLGHIPDDSPNLPCLQDEIAMRKQQGWHGGMVTNRSRGGVYPWTVPIITKILSRLLESAGSQSAACARITNLLEKLKQQTTALLLFQKTRRELEMEVRSITSMLAMGELQKQLSQELLAALEPKEIQYPYLRLPKNQEACLEALSVSTRYYFRRYMKKFAEAGGVFENIAPERVTEIDINDYLILHHERWGNESVGINNLTLAFHRELSRQMARSGFFRLFFAKLEGKRVASHACFDLNGRREYYFSGRALNTAHLPVGKLLCLHTILDAIDNGFDLYDFGYGGDDYKADFSKSYRTLRSIFLYRQHNLPDLEKLFPKYEYMALEC